MTPIPQLPILFLILATIIRSQFEIIIDKFDYSIWKNKPKQWFDPSASWTNKNKSKSIVIRWIMRNILTMFTDFRHLLSFIERNMYISAAYFSGLHLFVHPIGYYLAMNLLLGAIFFMFYAFSSKEN